MKKFNKTKFVMGIDPFDYNQGDSKGAFIVKIKRNWRNLFNKKYECEYYFKATTNQWIAWN